ncbi:GIY-YIG nuclease family protein [Candidatus Pacearchaeota archaeon]|jgi:group I intron endonuclease|nr:GIY-YIG nuclease family protein [Candidatus Pacearchaeota archaeon]
MIIYKVTNLVNGKIYIGKTIRTLEQRQNEHYLAATDPHYEGHNSVFHKAIRAFGIENFEWKTIDTVWFAESLALLENKYIDQFKSLVPHGYNSLHGHYLKLFPMALGRQNLDWDQMDSHYTKFRDKIEYDFKKEYNDMVARHRRINGERTK